jgi:hypothetical protein
MEPIKVSGNKVPPQYMEEHVFGVVSARIPLAEEPQEFLFLCNI